jgi:signal transduction histidine kinase
LTNVARHASAKHVDVHLEVEEHEIRLTVQDDGRGASPESTPHLGLLGIRERVTALGGTLSLDGRGRSGRGGFRLEAVIPTQASA